MLQYWFGGFVQIAGDGQDSSGNVFDANGIGNPFTGASWSFTSPQPTAPPATSSFVTTSGILPTSEYPQFESTPSSRWAKPGGPFDPHSGSRYVYSQLADVSYKRLTRQVTVPAGGGSLRFWTSHDTEEHWDFLAVEAHTPGQDNWTTLPDANGHTSRDTGDSCPEGWFELHPHLQHYQTLNADGTCSPTGTGGGEWHAASGNSNGWQEWRIDLQRYAGQTVEISIAYVSDWSAQNLGVFLDDFTLPDGTTGSFENGLEGWTIGGPAEGSGATPTTGPSPTPVASRSAPRSPRRTRC